MSSGNREVEVTFVVQSDDPMAVIARLENLEELAGHRLRREPERLLRDRYFDLPARRLQARGYALRLRVLDDHWLLCLKGRSRSRGAMVERLEIEGEAADPDLLARLGAEIGSDWPPALGGSEASRLAADPVNALAAAGFVLLQDRETLRRPRSLIHLVQTEGVAAALVAAGKDRVAELAIDTVTYVAAGTPLRHHEVEIEAGPEMESAALARLADALHALFPAELRPWLPSKLRTGLALEALALRHGRAALVGASGDLSLHGYALLREHLHQGRPDLA